MHRAFQTAMTYFKPELVVFLGDVFDEGKWAGDQEFQDYINRYWGVPQLLIWQGHTGTYFDGTYPKIIYTISTIQVPLPVPRGPRLD